jgi:putative toxin-antitoxin system antitoxin component (TIGR02293 family)
MAEQLPQSINVPATTPADNILAHALDTFGSTETADSWLDTPNAALRNQKPRTLANTAEGARQVEEVLTRIDYGIFS